MQWLFLAMIRLFDRKVKRARRSPSSLDVFRKRAMQHICTCGFTVAIINGIIAIQAQRYNEALGLELPVGLTSLIGFLVVRKAHRVEWIAGFFMLMMASCITFWELTEAQSAFSAVYVWYPLISFGTILLCGRRIGMIVVSLIFIESMSIFLLNAKFGFVVTKGMTWNVFGVALFSTMISSFVATFAIIGSVEISRQRADRANTKANASNLRRASLSLLGDMALDISRNMQTPLQALHGKLEEVQQWDPQDTVHNRGTLLIQNLQQSMRELGRLTESLLLFSKTGGDQEIVTLRAVDFLNHLNELTREKAISRGVSLDFSADQPQAVLNLPVASALFALVSLVNKGVEAAAGQEPAWVRLQLRYHSKQVQIRISDSGPSLSYRERRAIHEQTSQKSTWDVNLRLSLEFLATIGGTLSLDPYNPDTCFVLHLPILAMPNHRAA